MKLKMLLVMLLLTANSYAQDIRYCTEAPKRDADGGISRSLKVIEEFKQIHPCPATGKTGNCPGWAIDHVIPLACGGCDAIYNLQWLPSKYKVTGKDRWERNIYALKDSSICHAALVAGQPF